VAVDLLRRAGRPEEALRIAEDEADTDSIPLIQRMLEFEQTLIQAGDVGRHTVEEALRD